MADAARAIGLEPWQLTYINAVGIVYQPQENFLYIAILDRSYFSIYDLNNDQFLPKLITLKGYFPYYVFTNDDVSKIYSLNNRSDNVSVIDVNSKVVEKVIDLHDYISDTIAYHYSDRYENRYKNWLYAEIAIHLLNIIDAKNSAHEYNQRHNLSYKLIHDPNMDRIGVALIYNF